MSLEDSTLRTELERLPEDPRFLRLEILAGEELLLFPLLDRVTRLSLEREWLVELLAEGKVRLIVDSQERLVRLGERFKMAGAEGRIVDVRTIPPYSLILLEQGVRTRRWELEPGIVRIGRQGRRDNQVTLSHQSVSRAHASLRLSESAALIEVESQALTALNGERLLPGSVHALCHGDRIQLGKCTLVWVQERAPTTTQGFLRLELLGGFRLFNKTTEVHLKTEKAKVILSRLALLREESLPLAQLLEDLWPERPAVRQRKNLSHALKALQSDLQMDDGLFQELVVRTPDSLRLGSHLFSSVDIWKLQDRCEQGAREAELVEWHRSPLLPEMEESWSLTPRRQLFLRWLDRVGRLRLDRSQQQTVLDSITNTLSVVSFEEFVYQPCFELARSWNRNDMISLWSQDYSERLMNETGDRPSDIFLSWIGSRSDDSEI
ncbi:MAG TPA: FHA domain-containing protein [Phycisphaerales bacterium]|nr:FHA domain-containing protein [Phycisphaerales bacterium]